MDLEQVNEMAKRVSMEHDRLEHAKEQKAEAEDALLDDVVRVLKPALPAMSSKVEGLSGPLGRAVLVDRTTGIYLGEQGDFFLRHHDGRVTTLTTADVLGTLDLGSVVGQLVITLHAQIGSREARTLQIEDEAARLRAVALLLSPAPGAKRRG